MITNNKNNGNGSNIFTPILLAIIAVILCCILYELHNGNTGGKSDNSSVESTEKSDADVTTTVESHETDIKDWSMKLDSGEEVSYHTPEGFYSLTDQYIENLKSYYQSDSITSDSMICVGDKDTPYDSGTVINANKLSDISNMLKQLYGDEFKEEDVVQSEAYTYMTTGKLPEELPDNYKIDEIDTYTVDGIEYVAYEVNYDMTYQLEDEETSTEETPTEYTDESLSQESTEESTEPSETTVHTQQVCCYSKTDDSVEILIYQSEFNRDEAVKLLKEFLGVTE